MLFIFRVPYSYWGRYHERFVTVRDGCWRAKPRADHQARFAPESSTQSNQHPTAEQQDESPARHHVPKIGTLNLP